ncbi:MAG TPA: class IV adenylate cyclase [Bryobacteraceae bacterium]|nr:class IV adenylate cyclase [Bryobacteraceae bacterium]
MAHGGREIEIKLAVASASAARRLLQRAGFRVHRRKIFEANTVFDTPDGAMRSTQRLLRVREAAGEVLVTYKGPPEPGPHKSREELETAVSNARLSVAILDRLGYRPMFRYEKYRAEYRRPGSSGVATVDETPIGTYVELEGNARWIDRTAKQLGFTLDQYITASYGSLYLEWCQARGLKPGNMVFEGRSQKSVLRRQNR